VVALNSQDLALADLVDAVGVPGVVPDDVAGTHQRVDGRQVGEHRIERDPVPVDVGDDAQLHYCSDYFRTGLILSALVSDGENASRFRRAGMRQ